MVKESYLKNLGDKVHSIYLRGSLPRGMAVDGFSDLDTFALIHEENLRWQKAEWQAKLEESLQKQFSFVREIEITLSSFYSDFHQANPPLSMILKTQSLCIWGKDILPELPKFKPGKEMMLNYRWIAEDVNNFLLKKTITPTDSQNIMKVLLRTGFELVLEQKGLYTTDLFLCYQTFSEYYPEKENEMNQALHLFLNPATNISILKSFVEEFGGWIIQEVKKILL